MLYNLELQFSKLNTSLRFGDRSGNILNANTLQRGDLICRSTLITLPNKITVEIAQPQQDRDIKLVAVWLGQIKFNTKALEKLFVYHHAYGQSRSCDWNFSGKVEFEFFEFCAIKYHLIMGTTI